MATKPRSKDMVAISKVLPHLSTATINISSHNNNMAATSMVISSTTNNSAHQPMVDSSTASTAVLSTVDLPRHSNRHMDNTHRAIPLISSLNKELTTRTPHLKTPTTLTLTSKISMAPPILLQAKRVIVVSWEQ